jgi:acetyltransferase-like isoleucine patch superfamily enzyme
MLRSRKNPFRTRKIEIEIVIVTEVTLLDLCMNQPSSNPTAAAKPEPGTSAMPVMNPYVCVAPDVKLGRDVRLSKFINLYGCEIGDESKIGAFVEIQKNATVGRRCKISSHTFICEGVTIEDNVFIGHGVMFINDSYPRATAANGNLQTEADWKVEPTVVKKGASLGSGATILCGISIGENAIVGAGSVVTKDVPPGSIVAGNPAKVLRYIEPTMEVS